jgi:uncharacterized protein (DUF1697 family)
MPDRVSGLEPEIIGQGTQRQLTTYVAFLRGINVGGKSMVAMDTLAGIGTQAGLGHVRTYLNSGNLLFTSDLPEGELQDVLEQKLQQKTGREISVVIRSIAELDTLVKNNPFPDEVPSQVGVQLIAAPVPKNILAEFKIPGREEVVPGTREVYVHYPDGMGRSKLKWPPSLKCGTMRNITTLTKLSGLGSAIRE